MSSEKIFGADLRLKERQWNRYQSIGTVDALEEWEHGDLWKLHDHQPGSLLLWLLKISSWNVLLFMW